MSGPEVYAAEVTAFRPGDAGSLPSYAWGADAWGTPPPDIFVAEATEVFRVSDSGYRTEPVSGDVTVYLPHLERTVDFDRQIALAPDSTATAVSWGTLRLINSNGRWDDVANTFSCEGRTVRLLRGKRTYDSSRGLWLDPSSAYLQALWQGLAGGWRLAETALEVTLRDTSSWLDQPYQQNTYAGTGGLEGDSSLAGQTKPRVRGGTSSTPVRQVTPVLVDPAAGIYQYTDGPGTVLAVYENGYGGNGIIPPAGDTTDLYSGTTPASSYRTDNSKGLFQLGSPPAGTITADVTGAFPTAGSQALARDLARFMLTEDMGVASAQIAGAAWDFFPAGPISGWFWPSGDTSTGREAVSVILRGMGAKLITGRNGQIYPWLLRTLPTSGFLSTGRRLTPAEIVDLRPNTLPAPLDPPPYRWRVGYSRNHTVQTNGLSEALTPAQRRALSQEWQFGVFADTAVLAAYATASDPEPVTTALLQKSNADALAAELGALWSARRRLYDVTLPVEIGIQIDLGTNVTLTFPFGDLRMGKTGQVVGESFRGNDGLVTLQVLV